MARYEGGFNEISHFDILPVEAWVVRNCEQLREELKECRSLRGRFHQYFIDGETADCSQWKTDLDHCMKWRNSADHDAIMAVAASEHERRNRRLAAHRANNVWTPRTAPPANWNKPLPRSLQEKQQRSMLYRETASQESATN